MSERDDALRHFTREFRGAKHRRRGKAPEQLHVLATFHENQLAGSADLRPGQPVYCNFLIQVTCEIHTDQSRDVAHGETPRWNEKIGGHRSPRFR